MGRDEQRLGMGARGRFHLLPLAIFINMSLANRSGVLIPLVLKRFQIDPALSGAVILTTVTDMVGFLSFLGLATLIIL